MLCCTLLILKELKMKQEELVEILRQRVREFGEKPAYILYPDELKIGAESAILRVQPPEDQGDGTIITRATFEGNKFLCVTEKD